MFPPPKILPCAKHLLPAGFNENGQRLTRMDGTFMRNSEYIAFYQRDGGGAATLRLSVVPDHQLFATGIFVKTLTEKIIVVENAAPSDSIAFLKHRVHDIEGGAFLPAFTCLHDALIPSFFDLYNCPPSHRHSARPTAADLLW